MNNMFFNINRSSSSSLVLSFLLRTISAKCEYNILPFGFKILLHSFKKTNKTNNNTNANKTLKKNK